MPTADQRAEWLHLLQATDALYPTGAYAHSLGLEGLVEIGMVRDAASLEQHLALVLLPQLAHAELPWIHLAHAAAREEDESTLMALDEECRAQRATHELRDASARMGAQRIRLAAQAHATPLLIRLAANWADRPTGAQAPVAAGAIAACQGVCAAAASTAHAYQAISGQLAAAMKLIRIGQMATQDILARLLPGIADAAVTSEGIDRDAIGWFAPAIDVASARHETAYTRLFIS